MKHRRPAYRNLKPVDEAREIFASRFKGYLAGPEIVPVRQALGRILVKPVRAARSVPAYHAAAVDGVAVRAVATFPASPENPVSLRAGTEAIRVDTGDPLPDPADAVVMIEKVEAARDFFEIRQAVYPWQNVRKTGEDIVKGEIIVPGHHRIRSYDQGALLAAGVLAVTVFRKPRVLVIPTGDEIVQPEQAVDPLQPGVILEVNGQILASMISLCGADPAIGETVPDDPGKIKEAVVSGIAAGYDLILIIAGSSAGSEDYTPRCWRKRANCSCTG